jgi:hypothetical protein
MWWDQPFKWHPNLSNEINANIALSELDGGAYLDKLAIGKLLHVVTQNRIYTIEHRADGFWISGHPQYCPEPTLAYIAGSTWGGSMLKMKFVGIGMHLEFRPVNFEYVITTTKILGIEETDAEK